MHVYMAYFVASARDNLVDTSLLLLLYATLSEINKKVLLTYVCKLGKILLLCLDYTTGYIYKYIHDHVFTVINQL